MARHRVHHRQTFEEIEADIERRRAAENDADREYTTPERLAALRGEPHPSPSGAEDGAGVDRRARTSRSGPRARGREAKPNPAALFDAEVEERIWEEIDDFEREGSCAPRGEPRGVRAAPALGAAAAAGSGGEQGPARRPGERAGARSRPARRHEPSPAGRIDYRAAAPDAFAAMAGLEAYVRRCGLERSLLDLVELRASQLDRCAYGVERHRTDARRAGEAEQRLDALAAWQDASLFTKRERAALAWTEAVTRLGPEQVGDRTFRMVRRQFSEAELVKLTVAIIVVNGWNRLATALRAERGWPDSPEAPPSPGA